MLQMVSLSNDFDLDDDEDGPASSATAFFAIPAPKDKGPAASPHATPSGQQVSPVAAGPVAAGPIVSGPIVSGPVAAGPIASGPVVQGPVVQGPTANGQVASYSTGANASPFQVSGGTPPPPADHGARTQSNRVYAILLAMFFLVGVAVFVAVWFRPGTTDEATDIAALEDNDPRVVSDRAKKPKKSDDDKEASDTGAAEVDYDKAIAVKPVAKRPPRQNSGANTSSSPAPSAPKVGNGTVKIAIVSGSATMLEVTCPSGFRERTNFNASSATLSGLPSGEKCTAHFKGGAPSSFPVRGGQSLRCTLTDTTANCQ